MKEFENKTVIITGGTGMMGSYMASEFLEKGANVALFDINDEPFASIQEKLSEYKEHLYCLKVDVTNYQEVNEAVDKVFDRFGSIDVYCGVAGGSAREKRKVFYEQDPAVVKQIINVNFYGNMWMAMAVSKKMVEHKIKGRIIFTGSIVAVQGHKKHCEYGASKGAVIAMAKCMAKDLGEYGITVNVVSPGIIPHGWKVDNTNFLLMTPDSSDIVNMFMYLASEKSRFITGQNFIVDGGRSLGTVGTDDINSR